MVFQRAMLMDERRRCCAGPGAGRGRGTSPSFASHFAEVLFFCSDVDLLCAKTRW